MVELDLSGMAFESLPDDIARQVPKLEKLILDDCVNLSCLPVLLGSLKSLKHVSVRGCIALVHPPKSQQSDSSKTAAFLRQLHEDSVVWRRVKVP